MVKYIPLDAVQCVIKEYVHNKIKTYASSGTTIVKHISLRITPK